MSLVHHEDKANHLWCSFKNRMGQSNNVVVEFDLGSLISIPEDVDLGCLTEPFTIAEIESVLRNMPSDKAPGPDGFNGVFIKKC